jgi:diaminohydroxyphosphoribosylaminopyrimidine deaminase/5-amino-6-(5-phosphoribosylamino)uracil reductase
LSRCTKKSFIPGYNAAMTATDEAWMRQALALAERGRGAVEPNPLVGAVLVRGGKAIGEGWHQHFGGPHAEIHALEAATEEPRNATLFVSLEPCCHHGKTPPCTEAIVRAGVRKVVAAMADPFPRVAGGGVRALRAAGVEVEIGTCEAEARRLNAPYLQLLTKGRPWVHAKWAMTLDGKIATKTGDSRWISNEASRRAVHMLRGRMDAILVGIGTVLADNPRLTARPPGPRTPVRIILDSQARLPIDSLLASTGRETPTLVAVTPQALADRRAALQKLGCEVLVLPEDQGHCSLPSLLDELGSRRFTNVLVEGGSELMGSLRDAGFLNEVHVFVAPLLGGGLEGKTPMAGRGADKVAEALQLMDCQVDMIGTDLYYHGFVR